MAESNKDPWEEDMDSGHGSFDNNPDSEEDDTTLDEECEKGQEMSESNKDRKKKRNHVENSPNSRSREEENRLKRLNVITEIVRKSMRENCKYVNANVIDEIVREYFERNEQKIYKKVPKMIRDIEAEDHRSKYEEQAWWGGSEDEDRGPGCSRGTPPRRQKRFQKRGKLKRSKEPPSSSSSDSPRKRKSTRLRLRSPLNEQCESNDNEANFCFDSSSDDERLTVRRKPTGRPEYWKFSQKTIENKIRKVINKICADKNRAYKAGKATSPVSEEIVKIKAIYREKDAANSRNLKKAKQYAKSKKILAEYREPIETETDSDEDVNDIYEYVAAEDPETLRLRREFMDLTLPHSPTTRQRLRRLLVITGRDWMEHMISRSRCQAAFTAAQCKEFLQTYAINRKRIIEKCRERRRMRMYWERRRKEQEEKEEDDEEPRAGPSGLQEDNNWGANYNWESLESGRNRRSPPDDGSPKGKSARKQLF